VVEQGVRKLAKIEAGVLVGLFGSLLRFRVADNSNDFLGAHLALLTKAKKVRQNEGDMFREIDKTAM